MERTDAQRWADAESILDGDPSEFAVHQVRHYRRVIRILVWSLAGFFVIAVAAGVLVVVSSGHHGHHTGTRPGVPVWQEIVGLVVTGVGIVVLVVGLVRYCRTGAWRDAWRNPALVLTRTQRRELSAQIRGRAPLEPDHVRVARYVAELAAGPRARKFYVFLMTGLVLEFIGQLITMPSTGRVIYTGAVLVVYAALAVFAGRRQRQMRSFLEQSRSGAVQ